MNNPFVFDKYAKGESFCGRHQEIATLVQRCESGSNSLIYGLRRYGKSSLIHQLFTQLDEKKFICVYVDLFDANDEFDVAKLMYSACAKSLNLISKTKQATMNFFKRITLEASIGVEGDISFNPKLSDLEFKEYLADALDALSRAAEKENKKVVIALDEFQQIDQFKSSIDATIRKHLQEKDNVVWLFSGSKRHLLSNLFFDQSKPLYRQAEGLEITSITEEDFYQHASSHLSVDFSRVTFSYLYRITSGESKLLQQVCNKLYYRVQTEHICQIDSGLIEREINTILDQEGGNFRMIDGNLTPNQRKTLRHIVKYKGENLTKKEHLAATNIAKSSLMSAIKSLYNGVKGQGYVIDKDYDTYFIPDRTFELWVYRNVFNHLPK